jgi:uncharacterized Zn finger protein (UPF0148 family)
MKLICPHCGLKGTADEALQDKKVRCPQCQKIFRLNEINIVTEEPVFRGATVNEPPEVSGTVDNEIPASQVIQQPGEVLVSKTGICSACGFSLSYDYLEEKDGKLYCRICMPA